MTSYRKPTTDEAVGIAWWNSLDDQERMRWMEAAGNTGVAADAWAAYKKVAAEMQQDFLGFGDKSGLPMHWDWELACWSDGN